MSANLMQHRQAYRLGEVAERLGYLPVFALILLGQVLHQMHRNNASRQIMLGLDQICGRILTDGKGGLLVGDLQPLLHAGHSSHVEGVGRAQISLHYIGALQKLQDMRLLFSDILESRLDEWDAGGAQGHFTQLPGLVEGKHWSEKTPIIYRLPSVPFEEAQESAFQFCFSGRPMPATCEEKASFL